MPGGSGAGRSSPNDRDEPDGRQQREPGGALGSSPGSSPTAARRRRPASLPPRYPTPTGPEPSLARKARGPPRSQRDARVGRGTVVTHHAVCASATADGSERGRSTDDRWPRARESSAPLWTRFRRRATAGRPASHATAAQLRLRDRRRVLEACRLTTDSESARRRSGSEAHLPGC
jgi:hypothetical protein